MAGSFASAMKVSVWCDIRHWPDRGTQSSLILRHMRQTPNIGRLRNDSKTRTLKRKNYDQNH